MKCANIFLFENGNKIKIGDLNVSKVVKNRMANTQTGFSNNLLKNNAVIFIFNLFLYTFKNLKVLLILLLLKYGMKKLMIKNLIFGVIFIFFKIL